jgi:hypothetical protein
MFYGYLNVTNLQNVMMTYTNYTPTFSTRSPLHSDPKHLESVMNEELKKVDVICKQRV